MKSQKGVTLTTLTIYIIVATILLGTISFININVMSELRDLTNRSKITNEITKFYAYFVEDVKSANRVLEFSEDYIRFDNNVQYKIKYRADKKIDYNQTYDVYEIYRGNELITDKFSGAFFNYDSDDDYIKINLYANQDNIVKTEEQYFKVGRGY